MSLVRRVLAPLIAREIALHLRHGGLRASTVCPQYHARAYGSAQDECEDKDGEKIRARPRLDFSNTEEAFRSKKFSELLRHYLVYWSFSFNKLVDSSQKVCCQSSTPTHLHSSNHIHVPSCIGHYWPAAPVARLKSTTVCGKDYTVVY